MKYYAIFFISGQIIVPCDQNLAALFTDNAGKEGVHVLKDETGAVKGAFRWDGVLGIHEAQLPTGAGSGLVTPQFRN